MKVYQLSYKTALEIHKITNAFPPEEKYSLTDQSRSVPSTLAEAWKKRCYQKAFMSKIIDCASEAGETEVWLDFALDLGYIDTSCHKEFMERYSEINRMLYGMVDKSEKFCTKTISRNAQDEPL